MAERRLVSLGELAVLSGAGELAALGLGSCIAIVLYDADARVGGMAHAMLPAAPANGAVPARGRYAQQAVVELLGDLEAAGADRSRLAGWLVGGATLFANLMAPGLLAIGERNTLAARTSLDRLGIQVLGEAVGGTEGRSVRLDVATGRCVVSSVRGGDRVL